MRTKGRKKSGNVEDRRTTWKNNVYTFLLDSYNSSKNFKAKSYNQFKKDK